VFSRHPLINAICWDYFCAGYQTEDIIKISVDGAPTDGIIARRFVTPDDAPRVFWRLYRAWFTPSHAQVTSWKVDILHHVRQIHTSYEEDEHPIFTMKGGIVDAMAAEFPLSSEALRVAFEEKGLDNACEIYESLLDSQEHQQNTVKIIDWREPWRGNDFHVIEYCVRLLEDYRTTLVDVVAGGESELTLDTVAAQIATSAKSVVTKELRMWSMVANPVHENFQSRMTNLNQVVFWDNPHVQTLTNYEEETRIVREAVQLIVMYADLDPDKGINPAIDIVNQAAHGKDWSSGLFGDVVSTLHTYDRPMRDQPWAREHTTWQDGRIETNNYNKLIELVHRVPRLESLGVHELGELTPSGEEEVIAQIAPFEKREGAVKPANEIDFTTYALIAGAAVGLMYNFS
jgi:hypothetical protein